MNTFAKLKSREEEGQFSRGFALIATISILVLLALISVGLLSLSTVTVRSSSSNSAEKEARSNARMAAIMAIGQLQSLTGLDTRITASAKMVDANGIEATGVWRSWEGDNHDANGKPIAPDYDSKFEEGEPSLATDSNPSGRFLGWLTSTSHAGNLNASAVPESSTSDGQGLVKMVSQGDPSNPNTGTLQSADEVFLEPTIISLDGVEKGAYSWWTTGDNAKALVSVPSTRVAESESDWQQRLRGNRLPDPGVFGLAELDDNSLTTSNTVIPSRDSLELVDEMDSAKDLTGDEFYDLTTFSRGLLTNVATGGWRKDLSLFSEYYEELSRARLPLFSHEPGDSLEYNRVTTSARPSNGLLYHWEDYAGRASDAGWKQTPPICSWTSLVNYMKVYENLASRSTRSVEMDPSGGTPGDRYEFQEEIRIHPQVAQIQWVLSMGTEVESGQGGADAVYYPGIVVTPIVTLWNPYSAEVSTRGYRMEFDKVFPLKLSFQVGAKSFQETPLNEIAFNRIVAEFGDVTLGPGENKVFTMRQNRLVTNTGGETLDLSPGYRPNGGALFPWLDEEFRDHDNDPDTPDVLEAAKIPATADDMFTVSSVEFSADGHEGAGTNGIGVRFEAISSGIEQIIVMAYDKGDFGESTLDTIYPPINEPISRRVGSLDGTAGGTAPFATASVGLRGVSVPPDDVRFQYIRTKGMLQTNPLQQYAEVGTANDGSAFTNLAGSGAYHTVNAPYDFHFAPAQSWNDDTVFLDVNSSDGTYLVSGRRFADGVDRCVVAELPTRPLQSLADLQHFDARNNNQLPPFQFNLIGNSSAHPLFEPDEVSNIISGNWAGSCNDDSYLLNHVLFDDWFVSSIAPDFRNFSLRQERPISEVLADFLSDDEPLPNQFYRPSQIAERGEPVDLLDEYLTGRIDRNTRLYSFQRVASLFEVEGMFNVNSVSLDAWKAILRRNRDVEVPYFSSTGSVETEGSQNPAYPRTTVAGEASQGGDLNSTVSGYSALTDEQIDALASEIVNQVRARGPFLSLSEFVNRQLSTETDLALGGTIQRALDILAKKPVNSPENPFGELIAAGDEIDSLPPGNHDYKFPDAAYGSTLFGVPGWVRQADILRALAPVMSARDDTFTIRAYGDSRDSSGNIKAKAWCELVVQRRADYVDTADSAYVIPQSSEMASEVNRQFGRHYQLLSFRWLREDEV